MSFDPTLLLYVLGALLVIAGLAGLVLPALPGPPLVFGGMLVAAWVEDFERVGAVTLIVLAVMAALAYLIDFASGILGAKRYGASALALWGSAIGTVVGLFFGLPGLIFGPFVGATAGELIHSRRIGLASQVGMATWFGIVVGAIAKIALSFVMIGVFVFALIV